MGAEGTNVDATPPPRAEASPRAANQNQATAETAPKAETGASASPETSKSQASMQEDAARIDDVKERLGMPGTEGRPQRERATVRKTAAELEGMDHYERLGLPRNATEADIKAMRKILFDYHPDHGGDAASMQQVYEAYSTLSDPEKKSRYDASPKAAAGSSPDSRAQSYQRPQSTMGGLWESMNNISEGLRQQGNTSWEKQQAEAAKAMITEKIAQLEGRDPDEFITREGVIAGPSVVLHTTVGQYLPWLREMLQVLENETPLKQADLKNITRNVNGKIKFLGKSKLRGLWRKINPF